MSGRKMTLASARKALSSDINHVALGIRAGRVVEALEAALTEASVALSSDFFSTNLRAQIHRIHAMVADARDQAWTEAELLRVAWERNSKELK